jgi:small multidrug resistance pump
MDWFILVIAIFLEVAATTTMKLSDGFRKIWPWTVIMVLCFSGALYLLSLTLDTLPVGVVYAIWSGTGVALITVVAHFLFQQRMDRPALLGIGLIVAGVVVLQLFSGSVPR